jgi:hypothetical protein
MADKDPEEAARLAAIEQCTIPPGSATVCVRMPSAHGAKQIDGAAGASAYVDTLTHMVLSFIGKIKKLIKNPRPLRERPARLDRRQLYLHLLPGQPQCCSM